MAGVFISYRRGDAAGYAGRLREALEQRLGAGHVFRDADAIEPGQDFVQAIETRLGQCDALLALIGQEWLMATNAAGQRRLDVADDFVSLEIAGALKRSNVLVVPVLLEGARMPAAEELPQSIRSLAHRQAVSLRDESWGEDVDRLASVLRARLGIGARPDRASLSREDSTGPLMSPNVRKFWVGGVLLAALVAGALFVTRFRGAPLSEPPRASESSETRGRDSGASASHTYGIEIPRISEFADGSVTHTLFAGTVTARGNANLVQLHVRFANDGDYDANFWDRSYRLLAGDHVLEPTSNLNEVVSSHASKAGIVSFEVPAHTPKVTLRVDSKADPPGTLPLNLDSPAATPGEAAGAARGASARAVVSRVGPADQPLASNRSVSYILASVTSRQFVNIQRVIFAIRMQNRQNSALHFGSENVRVVVDGDSTAPIQGPSETVEGGSSSPPRDFVFDLPTSTDRVVLRTTLDGAVSEKPISLGQSAVH